MGLEHVETGLLLLFGSTTLMFYLHVHCTLWTLLVHFTVDLQKKFENQVYDLGRNNWLNPVPPSLDVDASFFDFLIILTIIRYPFFDTHRAPSWWVRTHYHLRVDVFVLHHGFLSIGNWSYKQKSRKCVKKACSVCGKMHQEDPKKV